MKKIIFILPNIFESTSGVSNKYINFIEFLIKEDNRYNKDNNKLQIILYTTFVDKNIYEIILKKYQGYKEFKIIKLYGIQIPFYKEIKIPILDESKLGHEIVSGNEIIIFNGKFFWIYDVLKNLKNKHKDKNIQLYPTWHTDYEYYANEIYSNKSSFFNFNIFPNIANIDSFLNHLHLYLETKIFNGIIVTGEQTKQKFIKYSQNIFNANEVNLDIFNKFKVDKYDEGHLNIIYCGRISKEKNIEEIFECCLEIEEIKNHQKTYNFNIHIIGNGPYLDNLKNIIDIKYKALKNKIVYYGNLDGKQINELYQKLDNRIFLFSSISETFGKSPMEAGVTGIPIFIKSSENSALLYKNKKTAFIFEDSKEFKKLFIYFLSLDYFDKQIFVMDSINNIKKYEQRKIFNNWYDFLCNNEKNKDKTKLNIYDIFTFYGISKFINCSASIMSD